MTPRIRMTAAINGETRTVVVEPRTTLADALREECGLTGTNVGCEEGVCGACTVLVDGEPVRACTMFAVQAHGREVRTVEGLASPTGELGVLQQAFQTHHAVQCGCCTPGFLMLATGAIERDPALEETDLAEVAEANLCRCSGYKGIARALREAAATLREAAR